MERSAGAIIFYQNKKRSTREYLLLHYPKLRDKTIDGKAILGHWDFPKGHIEKGEREHDTLRREVAEETGITNLQIISGFRESIRYFFQKDGKKIFKEAIFYLAQTKSKKVMLSFEHIGYAWLPHEQALETLTYKNAKNILQKAHEFMKIQHPMLN